MKNFRSRRGMTLITVLMAAVLVGIIAYVMMILIKQFSQSSRRLEKRADLVMLRQTLSTLIDCPNTLAGVNPANDCFPSGSTRKALTLKDQSNAAITSAITTVTGTFNPTDTTFQGSGSLGEWELRAYCDSGLKSLVVRAAKKDGTGFYTDPGTKIILDWENRGLNPLIGTTEVRLCSPQLGGSSSTANNLTLLTAPELLKYIGNNSTQIYTDHFAAHPAKVTTGAQVWHTLSVSGLVPAGVTRIYAKAFCTQAGIYSSGNGQPTPAYTGTWRSMLVAYDQMLFASAIDNTWDTATKIIDLDSTQSFKVMVVDMQPDFGCSASLLGYFD